MFCSRLRNQQSCRHLQCTWPVPRCSGAAREDAQVLLSCAAGESSGHRCDVIASDDLTCVDTFCFRPSNEQSCRHVQCIWAAPRCPGAAREDAHVLATCAAGEPSRHRCDVSVFVDSTCVDTFCSRRCNGQSCPHVQWPWAAPRCSHA